MDSTQLTSSPPTQTLIKQLASCNKSTRDKALKLLKLYLQSQQEISQDELKKIWKGLFFTVWHADKAPVQSDLINSLSCLLYKLPLLLSVEYLSVFFITMRREWTGIDGHRLDKFYLLIRRFVNACFVVMKRNNWDLGVVRRFVEVLENRVFFAVDGKGNGVNYHVASVLLDEFKGFVPVRKEVSWVLFGVLFEVMRKCSDKVLIGKIRSNVFDVLVEKGRELLERKKAGEEVEDETVRVGSLALSMGFAERFFELGSSVECVQVNRKVLFAMHEEFLKLEKDFEVSGVEILVADGGIEDDEEVPDLIPIGSVENGVKMAGEMENGASVSKGSKKKKKVKKEVDGSGKKKKKKVVLSEKEDEDMVIANGSDSVNETASDGINGTSTELIPNSGEMENGTSMSKSSKKKKKVKKDSDGSSKKKKKNVVSSENKDDNMVIANGLDSVDEPSNNENLIDFNESVVSNLRMQFEKVATEVGLDKDGSSSLDSPEVPIALISKKRKRARSADGKKKKKADFTSLEEKDAGAETSEKSAKKVRFSIKNNIVWKPHSPMPPQEMRLPPSVTPRGSALKKGLSPGPIREMPPATKKPVLKKKSLRGNKRVAPGVRRLRKMQGLTA